jgi:hypothetical protein
VTQCESINQSINQSLCGGGDLGGHCAPNSQIYIFNHHNNHFKRHRLLQTVTSAQRLPLRSNFQFEFFTPKARLRAR